MINVLLLQRTLYVDTELIPLLTPKKTGYFQGDYTPPDLPQGYFYGHFLLGEN